MVIIFLRVFISVLVSKFILLFGIVIRTTEIGMFAFHIIVFHSMHLYTEFIQKFAMAFGNISLRRHLVNYNAYTRNEDIKQVPFSMNSLINLIGEEITHLSRWLTNIFPINQNCVWWVTNPLYLITPRFITRLRLNKSY